MKILSFHPCIGADINIILARRDPQDPTLLKAIQEADVIILPQILPEWLYWRCKEKTPFLFPNYDVRFRYPGKIGQARLFKDSGIISPKTYIWKGVDEFKKRKGRASLPIPFVIKADRYHEAEGVFIIESEKDLKDTLSWLERLERSGSYGFVTQQFIPTKGNICRCIIIGKDIISFWKRPKNKDQLITSISKGAIIDREWRGDLQKNAIKMAERIAGLLNIQLAALDFAFDMEDGSPTPMLLEINYYFGRRGLGGSDNYYRLLYKAIVEWLKDNHIRCSGIKLQLD